MVFVARTHSLLHVPLVAFYVELDIGPKSRKENSETVFVTSLWNSHSFDGIN